MNQQFRALFQQTREFVRSQGGVMAPSAASEEELNPALQHDLSHQVHPLESYPCVPVPYDVGNDPRTSEFSFFEDGRQTTLLLGHIPTRLGNMTVLIPVSFCIVSAVILQRVEGRLRLWRQAKVVAGICVERALVPNQRLLEEFESGGLVIVDTEATGGNRSFDYSYLRQRAMHKAKLLRLDLEDSLIEEWRHSVDAKSSYLIIDGTLMNLRNSRNVARCVAVSKSFGCRYFAPGTHAQILQMPPGQRSWTFHFKGEDDDPRIGGRERVSWYLRLRTRSGSDAEFGLVRVEISAKYMDKAAEYAERFSRSLLSERLPSSFPYPRWDRHLYPVRACEMYLSSIMPATQTIRTAMCSPCAPK